MAGRNLASAQHAKPKQWDRWTQRRGALTHRMLSVFGPSAKFLQPRRLQRSPTPQTWAPVACSAAVQTAPQPAAGP